MKYAFPPLINEKSEILILGTLPGEDSLKFQQYYGHSRNAFWRIMGQLIDDNLVDADYTTRCEKILANRFALWDTLAKANREGSLDSNIKNPVLNDIPALLREYPNLTTIGFNGKSARKFFNRHAENVPRDIVLCDLPSSSPAYTLAFDKKLRLWQTALRSDYMTQLMRDNQL